MKVFFRTKEESNKVRQVEYLELEGGDRLNAYLHLMTSSSILPSKKHNNNHRFEIELLIDRTMEYWNEEILNFVRLASQYEVRMILVGGGAVNFHGYQRHSADVDFWIETTEENFEKLILVFREMKYDLTEFPSEVVEGWQNISVKFSPADLSLELITRFSLDKSFDETFKDTEIVSLTDDFSVAKWHVLSYQDLIDSKLKSQRAKDMLDIQELERIRRSK